jgi:hypothetical protein
MTDNRADEPGDWGRSGYTLPGPDYVACVFVFPDGIIIYQLYTLTLSDQAQVTATESQPFQFSVKIF